MVVGIGHLNYQPLLPVIANGIISGPGDAIDPSGNCECRCRLFGWVSVIDGGTQQLHMPTGLAGNWAMEERNVHLYGKGALHHGRWERGAGGTAAGLADTLKTRLWQSARCSTWQYPSVLEARTSGEFAQSLLMS